jgi:tetratricopeptide (TPR) repeat protein
MAYSSEIDKLERRPKENCGDCRTASGGLPQGRQLERAREVLRQGLVNNPDHIPGNIVLGRCCLDMHEDNGAEVAFSHVLELDPENVIALKALGEITERQGRLAEASQWLGRLMQVDPTNDDAREQLKRVQAVQQQAALVMSAEPIAAESAPEEPVLEERAPEEIAPAPMEPVWAKTRELTPPDQPPAFTSPAASVAEEDDTLVVEVYPTLVVQLLLDRPLPDSSLRRRVT